MQIREEYKATLLDPHLESVSERWVAGRWKFYRPRAPGHEERDWTDRATGEVKKRIVPDESVTTLPVLYADDEVRGLPLKHLVTNLFCSLPASLQPRSEPSRSSLLRSIQTQCALPLLWVGGSKTHWER